MSKKNRLRGKICIYCGLRAAENEDHVLSRNIFHTTPEENARKVPACDRCNNNKSRLENYVGTMLLFASEHPDAVERLKSLGSRRLAKNKKLMRAIATTLKEQWQYNPITGLFHERMTIDIQGEQVSELAKLIGRGLLWSEAGVVLTVDMTVQHVWLATTDAERAYAEIFSVRGNHVDFSLASGLFDCQGVISDIDPRLSVWRFRFFGGIALQDERAASIDANIVGVLTGPEHIFRSP